MTVAGYFKRMVYKGTSSSITAPSNKIQTLRTSTPTNELFSVVRRRSRRTTQDSLSPITILNECARHD